MVELVRTIFPVHVVDSTVSRHRFVETTVRGVRGGRIATLSVELAVRKNRTPVTVLFIVSMRAVTVY